MAGPWQWSTGSNITTTPSPTPSPAAPPQDAPAPAVPLKVQKTDPLDDHPVLETSPEGWKGSWNSARALQLAMDSYRKNGRNIRVQSGMRSTEEQAALYAAKGPGWAAPPGHSNHEKGIAYDLHGDDLDDFAKHAEKYGFARPLMAGSHVEPWHFTYQPEAAGNERIWADNDPRLASAKGSEFGHGTYQKLAASMAKQRGFSNEDTAITLRMLQQESGFNPKAASAYAQGIPQFTPETLAPLLAKKGLTSDAYTKNGSVQLDVYYDYLPEVLAQNKGNWARTLAAYNAGQGGLQDQIQKGRLYPETQDYVARILKTDPQTAAKWVLTGGGPTALPQNKDAQREIARHKLQQEGSSITKLLAQINDPYNQFDDGMNPDPRGFVGVGLDSVSQSTGSSRAQVVAKDLQERVMKPFARGITMSLLPIADYFANEMDSSIVDMSPQLKQMAVSLKGAQPFIHAAAETLRPDPNWGSGEQQALDSGRGGQDFAQWLWGMRPGGKSKVDADSVVANLASLGGELPALAGTTIAFELMGPKALASSPVGIMAGKVSDATAGNLARFASGTIDSAATWLQHVAPNLVSKVGPEFFSELGSTMTSFGTQAAIQGYGDALQAGKVGRPAVMEGLMHGLFGATMGGAFHLGSPIVSGMFKALKGGDTLGADAVAKQVGDGATPLLRQLNETLKDPANPLRQQAEAHVMSFVDRLDRMFGGQFTKIAEQRLAQLHSSQLETWAAQVQGRIGKATQDFGARVDAVADAFPQWLQRKQQEAGQVMADLQTLQAAKQSWEQSNAILLAEDKIKAGIALMTQEVKQQQAMRATGTPLLGGQLTPQAKAGIKELKLTPQDVGLIQQYATINAGLEKAGQRMAEFQELLNPMTAQVLAADAETFKAIASANMAIGDYMAGAQKDLQMNSPQSWSAMNSLADGQQRRAVVDQMVRTYGESIKTMISKAGLANSMPKRIYDNLLLTTRTIMEMAPANPLTRVQAAADSIATEMAEAQAILDTAPLPEPSATNVYKANPATVTAFENKLRDTQAYNLDLAQRQLDAASRLKGLEAEHRAMTGLSKAMGQVEPIQNRIKRVAADEAYKEVFQQTLKDNGLSKKSFTRVYGNLLTEDAKKQLPGDRAWERWKRDFGNRRDVAALKALKKTDPEVKAFYERLRKDGWATVPEGTPSNQAKLMVAKYVRANQLEAPDSPLVPQAVKDEMRLSQENGDPFVTTQVPVAWVENAKTSGHAPKLVESLDYNPPYKSGTAPTNRMVLAGGVSTDPSKLSLIDGAARYEVLSSKGTPVINISARKSVLNGVLQERMGADIHGAVTGGSGNMALADVHTFLTAEAENWWLGLTPDQAAKAAAKELEAVAYETQASIAPSEFSRQAAQGTEPVSPWTQQLGSSLQASLELNTSLRDSMKEWLASKKPASMREAVSRAYGVFENLWVQHHHQQNIANNIAAELSQKLEKGVSEGTINLGAPWRRGESPYARYRELPEVFRNELAEALDSLQAGGEEMRTFLTRHPGMREVLGATFDMMRVLEEYRVSNPELQSLFRQAYWPMRFPELAQMQSQRRGAQALSGFFLQSEQVRNIQTFKEAEEIAVKAQTNIMKGLWSPDANKDPQTLAGRIEKFKTMTPAQQQAMFPDMTPTQISKMGLGLMLRNPVMDPAQIIQGQLSAVLRADLVRDSVKRLVSIPLPNSELRFVERLKFEGRAGQPGEEVKSQRAVQPPLVDSLTEKGEKQAMVPLSSVLGDTRITFAGEAVPTKELFIHPEVAHQFQKYFNTGELNQGWWTTVNELTRSGQLAGIGITYLMKLLANHTGAMTSLGIQNLLGGSIKAGAQQVLEAPFSPIQLVRMGRVARQDALLQQRAQMLGLNADQSNQIAQGISRQLGEVYSPPTVQDRVTRVQGSLQDAMSQAATTWQETTLAEQMGVKLADLANVGLTASRAMERFGIHAAVRDAALGAFTYWENIHYKGAFEPLVQSGQLSEDAARRLAGQHAAEQVNMMSGTMQGYLSTSKFRSAMAHEIWGQAALTPGVLRTEIHSVANAATRGSWGHKGAPPEVQAYYQKEAAKNLAGTVVAAVVGTQVFSFLINGHSTVQNDPQDFSAAMKVRVGDKLYDMGSYGAMSRWTKVLIGGPGNAGQNLAKVLKNQLQAMPAAGFELAQNQDRQFNPITIQQDPGPAGIKNVGRVAQYLLSRSFNLEQFAGPESRFTTPGERVTGMVGLNGSPVTTPMRMAGRVRGEETELDKARRHQMARWADQYQRGGEFEQAQALEKIMSIALNGKQPWSDERLAKYLDEITLARSARTSSEDRLRLAEKSRQRVPVNARDRFDKVVLPWLLNEESRL